MHDERKSDICYYLGSMLVTGDSELRALDYGDRNTYVGRSPLLRRSDLSELAVRFGQPMGTRITVHLNSLTYHDIDIIAQVRSLTSPNIASDVGMYAYSRIYRVLCTTVSRHRPGHIATQ